MENMAERQGRYLDYSADISAKELELRSEYADWLPESIVDAHCHCNLTEHFGSLPDHLQHHMVSTFPGFDLESSKRFSNILFPGKAVRRLRFSIPFEIVDLGKANEYLLSQSAPEDRIAVCGIPNDLDYTKRLMNHRRATALKMYYWFSHPPVKSIYQFFMPEILEEAQGLKIPIILHLPQTILKCESELMRLLTDFPRLVVVLAHMGVSSVSGKEDLEVYSKLASHENVFMDSSMVFEAEMMVGILKNFPIQRLMFGTDEPLNLIRGVVYRNLGLGQRVATNYPYHWANAKEQAACRQYAENACHLHWQALEALKGAIDILAENNSQRIKEMVFRETAAKVFSF